MTCAQLWTKTLTSISQKICYVKSGFQILCAVEEFSSLFSRLFSLMQLNWVQTIFHKDTGCLCHWEKTIMPGKLLCLSRQIIQKASSAHHNFFFCWKVDFLSFKKRPIINLYISLFNVSVFEPLQKKTGIWESDEKSWCGIFVKKELKWSWPPFQTLIIVRASDILHGHGPAIFRYFRKIPRNSPKNAKYREIRQK